MRRATLLLAACGLMLSGCADSHESLAADAIAILKDIADELSTIKDPASADATKPRLKELGGRWRDNARRRAEHQRISTKELARLDKKYGAQLEAALKRYFAEVARVRRVDGGEEALRELGEVKNQPRFHKK